MERKYYKAINFDLDTNELKNYYPRYQQAYYDLKSFFKKKGFSHRQGSGYVSDNKLSTADIVDIVDALGKMYTWVSSCVKKIDVTNVGMQYDLTGLLLSDDLDDYTV